MNAFFLNEHAKPYYRSLLNRAVDHARARKTILNADSVYENVLLRLVRDETFKGVEEAGERNMTCLKLILATVVNYLGALAADECILIADRMYVDVMYSEFRTIILPQRAYIIKGSYSEGNNSDDNDYDDNGGDDNKTNDNSYNHKETIKFPWSLVAFNNLVASTDESRQSQYIYQTFLVYNTIFTAILNQANPFDVIAENTSISVVVRNLGKCPQNKDRIKCCDLKYGGIPPGHIMCPPREMIKRVFKYAKWARNPNNYKRYNELIVRQRETLGGGRLRVNINNEIHPRDRAQLYLLDWQNFITEFMNCFGANV
jgi:hypothetical protein